MKSAKNLVFKLKEKSLHISFAESCTGGMCVSKLVDISGSSAVLNSSFVTYSKEAKIDLLGADAEIIDKFGIVSEETALQMAKGAALRSGAEVGVGITGLAGPGGDGVNPVGTVCFGFLILNKEYSFKCLFKNKKRNAVRATAVKFVYKKLNEMI